MEVEETVRLDFYEKQNQFICCLQEAHFKYKDNNCLFTWKIRKDVSYKHQQKKGNVGVAVLTWK